MAKPGTTLAARVARLRITQTGTRTRKLSELHGQRNSQTAKWDLEIPIGKSRGGKGRGGRAFLFATPGYTPKFISEKPQPTCACTAKQSSTFAPRPRHHEQGQMGGKPQHHSDPPFPGVRRAKSSELKSRQGARPPVRFDMHTNGAIRKTKKSESYAPAWNVGMWRKGVGLTGQTNLPHLPKPQ